MYGKLEDLVAKISEISGLSAEEVNKRVKEKETEFSGLISSEGAAHIVAKELGINLLENMHKGIKVANVVPDMNSVSLTAKVLKVFEPREFTKGDKKGKVVNVILADETGQIRMSLWDEQTEIELEEGQVIEIVNGYSKEDNRGSAEIRVGKKGLIKKSEMVIETKQEGPKTLRTTIGDLKAGGSAEIRAAVVQVFESNPFFFVCPDCGKRTPENKCETHGDIVPKATMVVNGVVDDGTGNIRAVFFGDRAEKLVGMTSQTAFKTSGNGMNPKPLFDKWADILGKEFVLRGYAKQNQFYERLEFIVNEVADVNAQEEAKSLIQGLEGK